MRLGRLAYRPVGMLLGIAAGAIAAVAFEQLWRAVPGGGDPPRAMDRDRGLAEILVAAALQGAVYAVVRAAVDRGGALAVRRLTGGWPG